jgi:uncharacterized protein YukE
VVGQPVGPGGTLRKVTPQMQQGVVALDEASSQIKSIYGRVLGAQQGLNQVWQGGASSQFTGGLGTWLEDLNQILASIEGLRLNLSGVNQDMSGVEDGARESARAAFQNNSAGGTFSKALNPHTANLA